MRIWGYVRQVYGSPIDNKKSLSTVIFYYLSEGMSDNGYTQDI